MKLLVVFGTRPELIKLAPLIIEAQRRRGQIELLTCSTGQHREMLHQALAVFGITPTVDLAVMQPGQTLAGLTARLMTALDAVLQEHRPDAVIVQGDTTSAFVGALAAFYQHIPVAHVEAGLRTGDLRSPFPEELNRVLLARLARWHFAPTRRAVAQLRVEGVAESTIYLTGNTVVDAVQFMRQRWSGATALPQRPFPKRPLVLVTAHRRENHGPALQRICAAIKELSGRHPELGFVFPVHLNPQVRAQVHAALGSTANVLLMDPVDFEASLYLQSQSVLVITDSGGLQEEAPSFGVPVIVTREHTERSEGVDAGFATLAGTETNVIVTAAEQWLVEPARTAALQQRANPYGDGHASARILDVLLGLPMEPLNEGAK